jgi:hypothetical protein
MIWLVTYIIPVIALIVVVGMYRDFVSASKKVGQSLSAPNYTAYAATIMKRIADGEIGDAVISQHDIIIDLGRHKLERWINNFNAVQPEVREHEKKHDIYEADFYIVNEIHEIQLTKRQYNKLIHTPMNRILKSKL